MCPCLLWMVAIALVIQIGQSVDGRRATEETGGQAVTSRRSRDSAVVKRSMPIPPTPNEGIGQVHLERLSRKMLRICHLEKKLKKAFGRRLTNLTSNLLRYYDLPSPMRLDPLLREAYLVQRCPHHKKSTLEAPQGPVDIRLPNNKTRTVVDRRVKVADSQTASGPGSIGPQKLRHHRESCTGIRVYVSFSDLGWADWIVQPKGFVTTICIGTCKLDNHNAYLLHTAKSKCCSPSHYKSLQVLHYDPSGSLNVTFLPDLVAVKCRCRRC